jgi:hypothetical protein
MLLLEPHGQDLSVSDQAPFVLPGTPEKWFIPGLVLATPQGGSLRVLTRQDNYFQGRELTHRMPARNILVPVLILPQTVAQQATSVLPLWEIVLSRMGGSRRLKFLAHVLQSNPTWPATPLVGEARPTRRKNLQKLFNLSSRSVGDAVAQAKGKKSRGMV